MTQLTKHPSVILMRSGAAIWFRFLNQNELVRLGFSALLPRTL